MIARHWTVWLGIEVIGLGVIGFGLSGCGGMGRPARPVAGAVQQEVTDRELDIRLMLSYDENSDGTVTRQELEDGLRRQFNAVDTNHDGVLEGDEAAAENARRTKAAGTAASPLIDWNQDGVVDFDEFATTARSVFETLDKNHDGKLTPDELRLPPARAMPARMPGGERQRQGG